MKKIYLSLATVATILSAAPAHAVCPVCVIAVGAGLGLSRYLGIDDTITGLWIGGFTVAMITWTINWARPKIKKVQNQKWWNGLIFLGYYALIAWPLATKDFIGHPLNKLWGIDKIILGITLGSLVFWGTSELYLYLKKKNKGKAYFPFQKVVMPFGSLAILSALFYLLTK